MNSAHRSGAVASSRLRKWRRARNMYAMLALPILWYLVFAYLPMAGIVVAFQDFSLFRGIFGSEFIGLDHFQRMFEDPYFYQVLRNTILLGLLMFLVGFPAPIIMALLLNEIREGWFKKSVQTISYLPYFVSVVALINITIIMLSPSQGIVNGLLEAVGLNKIFFMTEPGWFRPIYILVNLWVTTGWTSIIYLAAISGIDTQLYDAAEVDGAGRFLRIWHVTLPGILPTIVILFLINLPSIVATNFEMVLLLQQPVTYTTSDVIGTYVYRRGILNSEFDFATAVGFLFSLVSLTIIYVSNQLARRFGETSLW